MPAVAEDIRGQVLRSKRRFWQPSEFSGSPGAVRAELSRLCDSGELVRLRRGLYWRGPKSRLGIAPPEPREIVATLVGDVAVGEAEWSATRRLGLSTQLPRYPALAIPQRPPRNVPRVRLVDRSARRGRLQARLNDVEVAFLETLEGWERFVEAPPEEARARLLDVLDSDEVRPKRLALASSTEPAVVRERLRALLREDGFDEEAVAVRRASSPELGERLTAILAA